MVAGWSASFDGDVTSNHGGYGDFWIVKLDSSGSIKWEKSLGGSKEDVAHSVQQTKDGGYIVSGYTRSGDGDVSGFHGERSSCSGFCYDFWVVKLDNNGSLQWQNTLGGTEYDEAYSVQQTTDGGYIVAGGTLSCDSDVTGCHSNLPYPYYYNDIHDMWVVKLDGTGIFQWEKDIGGWDFDYCFSIKQTHDDGFVLIGESMSSDGDATCRGNGLGDIWVVKLSPDNVGISEIRLSDGNFNIHPNPTKSRDLSFSYNSLVEPSTISIFNIGGKEIASYHLPQGSNEQHVKLPEMASGVYVARLITKEAAVTKRFIKE